VQPGAAVVPASATLYAMGIELPPMSAAGFDLSCMDKYRCASEGVRLWDSRQKSITVLHCPCHPLLLVQIWGHPKGHAAGQFVCLNVYLCMQVCQVV
jgi:hypothetical protein